ncbi:hypothetical protein K7W42_17985 [Deinococcus sp. HMF7604]|uniref:hypothetical protein n=1 Tax=Deinococcus betulae TaxID=2873312 RepID=UPI001CCF078F|nr:hypothetical protein [Deinococcus betulae]MBZ9752735.1 hypothetical protein [Deinococcus betulae]
MILHHRQQSGLVGCLYHSLYALTGDEAQLAHVEDVSDARFAVRLAGQGLMAFPLWVTPSDGPVTETSFWTALRDRFTRDNVVGASHAPLLVAIPGTGPPMLHSVALALPITPTEETVQVSDSNFDTPLTFSWAAFLLSDYSRAHRVEMLAPLELDAYPPDLRPLGGTP